MPDPIKTAQPKDLRSIALLLNSLTPEERTALEQRRASEDNTPTSHTQPIGQENLRALMLSGGGRLPEGTSVQGRFEEFSPPSIYPELRTTEPLTPDQARRLAISSTPPSPEGGIAPGQELLLTSRSGANFSRPPAPTPTQVPLVDPGAQRSQDALRRLFGL